MEIKKEKQLNKGDVITWLVDFSQRNEAHTDMRPRDNRLVGVKVEVIGVYRHFVRGRILDDTHFPYITISNAELLQRGIYRPMDAVRPFAWR